MRVSAERIINTDEERRGRLKCQCGRATSSAIGIQRAGSKVETLCGRQCHFQLDYGLLLRWREWRRALA